jgi:hypothetical protein
MAITSNRINACLVKLVLGIASWYKGHPIHLTPPV